jgi:hypothetical protein
MHHIRAGDTALNASAFGHEIFTCSERCTVPLTAQDSILISQKFTCFITGALPVQKQDRESPGPFLHIRDERKERYDDDGNVDDDENTTTTTTATTNNNNSVQIPSELVNRK